MERTLKTGRKASFCHVSQWVQICYVTDKMSKATSIINCKMYWVSCEWCNLPWNALFRKLFIHGTTTVLRLYFIHIVFSRQTINVSLSGILNVEFACIFMFFCFFFSLKTLAQYRYIVIHMFWKLWNSLICWRLFRKRVMLEIIYFKSLMRLLLLINIVSLKHLFGSHMLIVLEKSTSLIILLLL